jgi:[CysO sulfur-carrier protein]-S-L-cysteine hydrolase
MVFCVGFGMTLENQMMLSLDGRLIEQLLNHAESCLPEEACGLVGGKNGVAHEIIPITNELHSEVRFRMSPEEQLKAFLWLEQNQMDLIAIYHTHPKGPPFPSKTDLFEYAYPEVIMIICIKDQQNWILQGYRVAECKTYPVELNFTTAPKL